MNRPPPKIFDVAIIGGGIIGVATAMALLRISTSSLVILEKEEGLATHQSGRNSGVIHAGLYYRPGSLKALYCTRGREKLYRFCRDRGIRYEMCGKVVVATSAKEEAFLSELTRRGTENGIQGITRLSPEEVKEREPHVTCRAAIFVPASGIVDFRNVTESYAAIVQESGGEILTGWKVKAIKRTGEGFLLITPSGEVKSKNLINCAGLHADRIASACGLAPGARIVPFRGDYYTLTREKRSLVKNLIYPVPDPDLPFLGVHLTRTIDGKVEAGPSATLAFSREGYSKSDFSIMDTLETFTYTGFWKLAARHLRTGITEFYRTMNRAAFAESLRKMVPGIEPGDLEPASSGVRAQALGAGGELLDDFEIMEEKGMIHVLNAPSPAATASIVIGEEVAGRAKKNFNL